MSEFRGRAAVVGVGESRYYRYGKSPDPEFVLCLQAVLNACNDASIDPKTIDGFVSYADDRNVPVRMAAALGVDELRWSALQWGGGGGGAAGAVQQAAAAVICGLAERVVVYRGLAQGQSRRYGAVMPRRPRDSFFGPYGMLSGASLYASRVTRFFHETGISPATQRAVAMASYFHAQQNPNAVMYGRPLTEAAYDSSRWIVEPFRLYDCCLESDGAAAIIVTASDRAADLRADPVYVLAGTQGAGHRGGGFMDGIYDAEPFATAEFGTLAPRLYEMAGVSPTDVDVVQIYENFTGGVVMALIELGLCAVEEADSAITFANLVAPTGRLPLNTSGGNMAEAYVHGFGLQNEAIRQLRGTSVNQVPGARIALTAAGPMVSPTSCLLYATGDVL
jgi:acetyl-CoA acetyltransferase